MFPRRHVHWVSRSLHSIVCSLTLQSVPCQGFVHRSYTSSAPSNVLASISGRFSLRNRASFSTVTDSYTEGVAYLKNKNVEDAEDSARHLLCDAASLGPRYSDFERNRMTEMTAEQEGVFREYCEQRSRRVPVQYILGNWDFYGLNFECKPPVLIPRPETEELVQCIVDATCQPNNQRNKSLRILDIGSGTGAIGISLLNVFPKATCVALDVNPKAVELSRSNAQRILGITESARYTPLLMSFQSYVQQRDHDDDTHKAYFDIVVSNPPYIPSAELPYLQVEVRDFEDHTALDGGKDGLDIVRDIIDAFPRLVKTTKAELWMEVHNTHPAMLEQAYGFRSSSQQQQHCESTNNDMATMKKKECSASTFATNTRDNGNVILKQSIVDMFGHPRFVRFTTTT